MILPWRKFIITERVILDTERRLQSFNRSRNHNEGFVYWAGRRAGQDVVALASYVPRCKVTRGSVDISEEENARFVDWLVGNELVHVAQVHSHPPGIDTHSWGDDAWAFMKFPGLLSMVVPNYGVDGMRPLRRCGVHVFYQDAFVLVPGAEVEDRLVVVAPVDRRSK